MNYKTVVFDLDGTLLNTLGDLTDAVNYAVSPLGVKPSTETEIRARVGNGAAKLLQRTLDANNTVGDIDECFKRFSEYYRGHMTCNTIPYDGIMHLLERLKHAGIKTAILTNKFDLAAKEIAKYYFGEFIDYTQGERADTPKKPAPDALFSIMEMFGSDKDNTLYIGDSTVDIQTAKNAGVKSVAVSWGYCDREHLKDASIIADRVYQLEDIIFGIDYKELENNFTKRGFGFKVFDTKEQATEYLVNQCEGKSVGFGGSKTLEQMGVYEKLKEKGINAHWHWKNEPIYMDGEIYLTSANGLSKTGEIVNIDGTCNRVAATLYNTKRCFIVCGINKISRDLEDTIDRARNISAPLNAKRLNKKVPCVITGKCENCISPERICKAMVILMNPPTNMECEIVLINDNLGY